MTPRSLACLLPPLLLAAAPPEAPQAPEAPESVAPPVPLETLGPLIDRFNAGTGHPRFIAIVSSTCPACVYGARAVRQSVLRAYPDADIQVSIVWIDILPSDSAAAANKAAAIFDQPPGAPQAPASRLAQFHDPEGLAGRAVGEVVLKEGAGPAWDVYLFYGPDARWTDKPPRPVEWFHQLGGERRADPANFRGGLDLAESLQAAAGRAAGTPPVDVEPPDRRSMVLSGSLLRIQGMKCAGCAATVAAALRAVPGVKTARVDFESALAWITSGAEPADDKDLIAAVAAAGFTALEPAPSEQLSIPARLLGLDPGACGTATAMDAGFQVLAFPGCPNADAICANLQEACRTLGLPCRLERIDLSALSADDPRRRWGSPTILRAGRDLMGEAAPAGVGMKCRVYPGGGVPTAAQLAERLRTTPGL